MNTSQTAQKRVIISASLIILMALLTALDSMAIDMYLPGMLDIGKDFNESPGRVQQTLAIFLAGLAIGQGLYGPVLDRYGRKIPLLIGIMIFIAGSIMCALAPTLEWLLAARFIQAIGAAAGLVTPRAIISDTCDLNESAKVFSLLMNAMMLGPIVAPILGGLVLDVSNWRTIFWVIAFIGLISLIWGWKQIPDSLPVEKRVPMNVKNIAITYGSQMTNQKFMCYALSSGFAMSALFLYVSGSSFVYREHFHLNSSHFSYLFALNSAGLVFCGWLSNRLLMKGISAHKLLVIGMLIHTMSALVLYFLTKFFQVPLIGYTALIALSIASLGLVLGNVTALTMYHGGEQAGAVSAVMGVLQYLLPAITGYIVSLFIQSASILPLSIGVCGLIGFIFLLFCRSEEK